MAEPGRAAAKSSPHFWPRALVMLSEFRRDPANAGASPMGVEVLTSLSRFCRAGAVVVSLGFVGATSARALDLDPFDAGAPQQTAQATLQELTKKFGIGKLS